jgi:hypothetical protein
MVAGLVVVVTMMVGFAALAAAGLFVYVCWRSWPSTVTPRAILPHVALIVMALAALVLAVDLTVGAFRIQAVVAAAMLVIGLGGFAGLGYRYRDAGWREETVRLSNAAGRWPWALAGLIWLAAWVALGFSSYDYVSEPSVEGAIFVGTLTVGIVPPLLGLLMGLGLLRRNGGSDDDAPPLGRA